MKRKGTVREQEGNKKGTEREQLGNKKGTKKAISRD